MSPESKRRISLAAVLLILLIFLLTSFGRAHKHPNINPLDDRDHRVGVEVWAG